MITLKKFLGGLGNQVFQVASIYAYAKKYGIPFNLPDNRYRTITGLPMPSYKNTVFKAFFEMIKESPLPKQEYSFNQWTILDFEPLYGINVVVDSFLMNVANFLDYRREIRELLLADRTITPENNKLCLTVRRFTEEGRTDWACSKRYYLDALNHLESKGLLDNLEIHVFGDEREWIEELLNERLPGREVHWFIGKRDGNLDVEHFYEMFKYNYFILCKSTYHYWPALLNDSSLVIFDDSIEWQKNIIPDMPNWIGL